MPFKDSPEGQTHYVGDGCNPPHSKPSPKGEEVRKEFDKEFALTFGGKESVFHQLVVYEKVKSFILADRQALLDDLKKEVEGMKIMHEINLKDGYQLGDIIRMREADRTLDRVLALLDKRK